MEGILGGIFRHRVAARPKRRERIAARKNGNARKAFIACKAEQPMNLIYAIGDIHGCHEQLLVALAKIKSHAGSRAYRAVFLGDYVDRGPKSRQVVNQVRGLVTGRGGHGTWYAIKGNHEDMMAASANNDVSMGMWWRNGGEQTEASYVGHEAEFDEHVMWLATLPTMFETENHVFVHAGCSPRYSLSEQPKEVLMWIWGWEIDNHDFGKHVVYGHTPRKAPVLSGNSSGLDTGACFWGILSVGVFDGDKACGPIEILQAA